MNDSIKMGKSKKGCPHESIVVFVQPITVTFILLLVNVNMNQARRLVQACTNINKHIINLSLLAVTIFVQASSK